MELLFSDNKKQIFTEDGNLYTLTNMGSLVGCEEREWHKPAPDYWVLTGYEEKETGIIITALIDTTGNYIKIALEINKVRRILNISNNQVVSDIIYDKRINSFTGEAYKVTNHHENYLKPLSDYLEETKEYKNEAGISIRIDNSGHRKIKEFLKANEEFKKIMNPSKKVR